MTPYALILSPRETQNNKSEDKGVTTFKLYKLERLHLLNFELCLSVL